MLVCIRIFTQVSISVCVYIDIYADRYVHIHICVYHIYICVKRMYIRQKRVLNLGVVWLVESRFRVCMATLRLIEGYQFHFEVYLRQLIL